MKLLKALAWLVGVLVVLVIGAVVLVPMLVDPNDYKAEIAAAAREHTGRDLTIEGDMSMTVFPWLGVKLGKVALGNAAGFSSAPFAATESAEVRVKLEPLLFERRLIMDTVTVHGLTVNLERNAKGKANWEDLGAAGAGADSGGSSGGGSGGGQALAGLSLGGVDLRDASFSLKDATTGQDVTVSGINLKTGPLTPGAPVPVEGELAVSLSQPAITGTATLRADVTAAADGQRIKAGGLALGVDLAGETLPGGKLQASLGADVDIDVAGGKAVVTGLVLDVGDLKANGKLSASGLKGKPAVTGELEVAQFDLKALLDSLGIKPPVTADDNALKAVSLTTGLSASAGAVTLEPLALKLDESSIKGSVGVADLAAMALRFDLAVDKIDADRYLPPPAEGESTQAATPGAAATALPLDTLRGLNVAGKATLGELRIAKLTVTDVLATVAAKGGKVRLSPLGAKLYGGSYKGDVTVDATSDTAKMAVNESLAGVQVAPLLKDLRGEDPLSGTASVTVKATAAGNTTDAMKRALNGSGSFKFTDGAINGINIAATIRDAKAKLTGGSASAANEPQRTDFSEMGGTFRITDGLVNNPDFAAKSPLLRIKGAGTANLVDEALDYRTTISVVATAKGQGGKDLGDLAGLDVPLKVGGTFSQPTYGLDEEALIKALASAKLDGAIGEQKAKVESAVKEKLSSAVGGDAAKALGGVLGGAAGGEQPAGGAEKASPAGAATKALKGLLGN